MMKTRYQREIGLSWEQVESEPVEQVMFLLEVLKAESDHQEQEAKKSKTKRR